ncbi:MAG: SpoIIE family protein phosphatase [Spirochaetia bacterium]|nr:SpoIIE family protein phosphatase [Spirochaetota bacterium]MCX8096885.1 SpoIIE family protein phosphatase [Spirochaetota bacterium]MDW8112474.1 SpoIIE family protein phosphatase [Spirochaetia bacterium]
MLGSLQKEEYFKIYEPSRQFPINLLGFAAKKSVVVDSNVTTDEVVNLLLKDNEIAFVIVTSGDEIINVLESKDILNIISARFGQHIYGNKPVIKIANRLQKNFSLIEANKPVRSIIQKISKNKQRIVITINGNIYGATNPDIIYSVLLKIIEEDSKETGRLQNMIINKSLYPSNVINYEAVSIPSFNAGGDYIFVKDVDNNQTLVVIADVSGKGTSAAIITSMISFFFKSLVESKITKEVLVKSIVRLNNTIIDYFDYEKYITMVLCVVNKLSRSISIVNMGHQPVYVFEKEEIIQKRAHNTPIGLMDLSEDSIVIDDTTLGRNKKVFLFTDGVTDIKNSDEMEYGEKRLEAILLSYDNTEDIKSYLLEDIMSFSEDQYQVDDISFIIFEIKD